MSPPEQRTEIVPEAPAGLRAWAVLFGALTLAAGHGAFLFAALSVDGALGKLGEIGRGRLGALAIAWLIAAPVLALLALVLRRPLMKSRLVSVLATGVALITVVAFAVYLRNVVRVD